MNVQRVDGIKYNFDRLTEDELKNIQGHLLETHARIVGEVALVEGVLFDRRHPQLFDEEPELQAYGEIADPATWQAFIEATKEPM